MGKTHQIKLKRLIFGLALSVAILIPIAVAVPVRASSGTIFLSPSSGSFTVGSTITLAVKEDSGEDYVDAVLVNLAYPSDKLELEEVINSPAFSIPIQLPSGDGTVVIARGALPAVNGAQTVASIKFKVKAAGSAQLAFTGENYLLQDTTDLLSELPKSVNYTLKVAVNQPPAPSSSAQATSPAAQSAPRRTVRTNDSVDPMVFFTRSDFNHNELVDVFDLTILLNNYLKQEKNVDINKDGSTNTIDLSVLLSNYGR